MSDRLPVTAPDLEAGTARVVVGQWYAEPGDAVFGGDALLELLLPGLTVSVNCPADGRLDEICRHANSPIQPGDILAWVEPEAVSRNDAGAE